MKNLSTKTEIVLVDHADDCEFAGDRDIDHIAQTLSPDIARLLMAYYSGVELKLPKKMHRQHHIALHIGFENACLLSEYAGGAEPISIPVRNSISDAARNSQIIAMIGDGICRREIALELGICMRQLRRITQKLGLSGKSKAQKSSGVRLKTIVDNSNALLTGATVPFDRKPSQSNRIALAPPDGAVIGKYGYFFPQQKQVNT